MHKLALFTLAMFSLLILTISLYQAYVIDQQQTLIRQMQSNPACMVNK